MSPRQHIAEPVYCLVYTSIASLDIEHKDVVDLASKSAVKNKSKNISGVLLYHDMSFLQVLEGPQDQVLALYESIKSDKRHFNVIALHDGDAPSRCFADWGMAVIDPASFKDEDPDLYRSLAATTSDHCASVHDMRIDRLLNSFRRSLNVCPA